LFWLCGGEVRERCPGAHLGGLRPILQQAQCFPVRGLHAPAQCITQSVAELVQGGALLQDNARICEAWTASKATKARTPEQAIPATTVHQVTSGLRLRNATVSQRRRIRLMGVRGRWILIVVVLALNGPTFSQVYKWVDQAGVTHYGSVPPTGAGATRFLAALSTPHESQSPPKTDSSGSGTEFSVPRGSKMGT
jgi:hypothetical protein